MSIDRPLTSEELEQALQQAQAISQAATPTVQGGQFVFFAAFDGTNNIKSDPAYSNDPQSTNVGQLYDQAVAAESDSFKPRYYPGPGTPGTLPGSSALPPQVTQEAINTANLAYNNFASEAAAWLKANPGGSITTAVTAFSRGGPAAVVFAQLLNDKGLTDPDTGAVLLQPGQVSVSAMLLFDPVSTGFYGDLRIPSNVSPNNIVVLQAQDEFRMLYKGDDYSADPRVRIIPVFGNHGDAGGFYDQGLGALYLEGGTGFFQGAGIALADVPAERQFNPAASSVIHTEGVDSNGARMWDEYGTRGNRLLRPIGAPSFSRIISDTSSISTVTLNGAGQLTMTVERDVSGHRVTVEFVEDEWGDLRPNRVVSVDGQPPASPDAFAHVLDSQGYGAWEYADGSATQGAASLSEIFQSYDPTRPSGADTLVNAIGQYGGTLIDALSIIKAIQSGDPLPIVASGLRLANDLTNLNHLPNLELSGVSSAVSGVLSLLSLDAVLERGDTLAAVTAGAQALSFGANAYADFARAYDLPGLGGANQINEFLNGSPVYDEFGGVIGVEGGVLPVLGLVSSLANGDITGAAVSAMSMMGVPYIGWAYAVYSIVSSLFSDDDIPDPWGSGRYVWDGSGIRVQAAGETGGYEAVSGLMNGVLSTMNALIERAREQNPAHPLGLIPNRMPSLGYGMDGFHYTDIDPLSGAQKNPSLRYDTSGRPYNAEVGSPESYQSLGEAFIRSALGRGAIAPEWEVLTARIQTEAGDPSAGLTEEERAGRAGQLAPSPLLSPAGGEGVQLWRPVALDLDGDGIETIARADSGVAFDVDDSGFLKGSAWLGADDAFLTLDRNYNGHTDSGRELFSNGTVALERRGLAGLAWVDANGDRRLTAADSVFGELRVWQDADGDGAVEAGEEHTLAELGITELDYGQKRYVQNGEIRRLDSPDLEADAEGARVNVVPGGILVEASSGQVSLLVHRIEVKANDMTWRMAA